MTLAGDGVEGDRRDGPERSRDDLGGEMGLRLRMTLAGR